MEELGTLLNYIDSLISRAEYVKARNEEKGIFNTYTFEFNFNEIRFEITSDTTRKECLERYKFLWYQQELPKDFKG